MKKLNLKKIKIATIGNANLLKGGTNSTYGNTTGVISETCRTNCCPVTSTNPGPTRPNGSVKTKLGLECLGLE